MNKLSLMFLQNHSQCSFASVETMQCTQQQSVSVLPPCICMLSKISHLCKPLRMFHQKQSVKASALQLSNKQQEVPGMPSQVCFLAFFNSWPSTTWAIICDKLKQVPQAAPFIHHDDKKGSPWTSGLCLLLLKRTQSVPLPSVLLSCL